MKLVSQLFVKWKTVMERSVAKFLSTQGASRATGTYIRRENMNVRCVTGFSPQRNIGMGT